MNSANCECSLSENKIEDPNIDIEFEPFVMPHTEDTIFVHDLTTSYFLKDIIETSFSKISAKPNEILLHLINIYHILLL